MTEYIQDLINTHPDQQSILTELIQFYNKKLWHQLTTHVQQFMITPFLLQPPRFLHFHQFFLTSIVDKLNPLTFALFTQHAAAQCSSVTSSLEYLESLAPLVEKDEQAYLLLHMVITRYRIEQLTREESESSAMDTSEHESNIDKKSIMLDQCKERMDEAKHKIDSYSGVMDVHIYAAYYLLCSTYYEATGKTGEYYTNALLYLTYTPLSSMAADEKKRWATRIALSAILSDKVWSFGELLQHDIIKVFENTDDTWIPLVLNALNMGNMTEFHSIVGSAPNASRLQSHSTFLQLKIRIMALIDFAFRRSPTERVLTFAELAEALRCNVTEVEQLLLKALAVKVIKGTIDGIDQVIRVKWVQPRVLDKSQIGELRTRLTEWSKRVDTAARMIENNATVFGSNLLAGVAV